MGIVRKIFFGALTGILVIGLIGLLLESRLKFEQEIIIGFLAIICAILYGAGR